jgi:NADH:ubiquinone oxidoreductase subunit 6 (subunit J)
VSEDVVTTVLFALLALVAVGFGYLVFRVDSMARATFALAVSFVAVGGILLLLDLDYLGVVVVVMMVMEMAIMAVFMIAYMMNPAGLMPMSMYHDKPRAMSIAVGTFVVLAGGALLVDWPERQGAPPADVTEQVGLGIMGSHMLVMMGIGAVILTTIVSALVLGSARSRYDRLGDDLKARPARDPIRGGVGR